MGMGEWTLNECIRTTPNHTHSSKESCYQLTTKKHKMLLLLPSENKTWTYKHEMKRTFSVLPHRGMFACLSQYGKIIAVVSYRCAPALSLVITSSLLSYSSNQHHHSFPFCLQESFLMSWCDDGLIWIFRFFPLFCTIYTHYCTSVKDK